MVAPPSEAGAVHDRLMVCSPAVAVSPVGAPGVVSVVTLTVAEYVPVPAAFTAATWNT